MPRPPERAFAIRRIVVAIDDSAHAAAAAEVAAEIAERFRSAIEGLYVEDEDLMNLARLPVSRVVSFPGGRAGAPDINLLIQQMRRQSMRARRLLESVAGRRGIQSTFRVCSGCVATEIVAAASQADLLIVGVAGQRISVRPRAGSVAVAAASQASTSVLVHRAGAATGRRLLVCFDGTEAGMRALDVGRCLAAPGGAPIRVVIAAPDEDSAARLRERAGSVLAQAGKEFQLIDCVPPSLEQLVDIAAEQQADGLIIGAGSEYFAPERLLSDAPCPVLFAR